MLCSSAACYSQVLPDSITKKLDNFFKKWSNNTSPGYAIGSAKDHSLMLANDKSNDVKLTIYEHNHLFSEYWWMDHLQIVRSGKNQIQGFEVNSGRVMHLQFKKIE